MSSKLNRITFTDGTVTDIPGEMPPRPGQKAQYKTYVREKNKLKKDGIWKNTGFQHKIGYTWFEIWHH